jgi:4'-phosphopantetheinyl transferase
MPAPGPVPPSVEVWLLAYAPLPAAAEEACLRLLDAPEIGRYLGFAHPARKSEFAFARALARLALGQALSIAPHRLRIEAPSWRKPRLSFPAGPRTDFNITHSGGMAAVAVASGAEVGIDLEASARVAEVDGIAREHFAASEIAELGALPPELRGKRFHQIWTLKEAQLKAIGSGLPGMGEAHAFRVGPGGEVQDLGRDTAAPDGRRWWFRQFEAGNPAGAHILSLAVRHPPGPAPAVRLRDLSPDGFLERLEAAARFTQPSENLEAT